MANDEPDTIGGHEELPESSVDSFLRAAARIRGEPAVFSRALFTGAVVAGRYVLERRLGEGGMGVVWGARHAVTGRKAALKFLKEGASRRDEIRARFVREGRIAGALDHPSVIEIHDVFEMDDGTPVLVMPLLSGETLRSRLERERALDVESACRTLLPVASAVSAAHASGVIHRDLKPENVFVTPPAGGQSREHVTVLDFGVAKVAPSAPAAGDSGLATATGVLLGTACYMAPEQALAEDEVDGRADVWSLGVILYECLVGVRPIPGTSVPQVVAGMMSGRIPKVAARIPGVPAELGELVDRMLSVDRAGRPGVDEVIGVLTRHRGTEASSASPLVAPAPPGRTGPAGNASRRARSARLFALAVVLVAAPGAWTFRGNDRAARAGAEVGSSSVAERRVAPTAARPPTAPLPSASLVPEIGAGRAPGESPMESRLSAFPPPRLPASSTRPPAEPPRGDPPPQGSRRMGLVTRVPF